MLDKETKRRIDTARDILVGKVPDPKSQVEQITIALIYKFMDDMDLEAEELGGECSFFVGKYEKYGWRKIFDPSLGGHEMLGLYAEALNKMVENINLPQLFRDIFKNAYLPFRDPETLKSFLKVINDFSYSHSEKLGDAFEYLLSVLGSQGDAGQFRTPRHMIDFMTALISPQKNETILDPACGTAGFLISSYKHILKENSFNYDTKNDPHTFQQHNEKLEDITINGKQYKGDKITPDERTQMINNICGYDISPDMVRLSLVNLYLHGFTAPKIFEYDTLTSEERWKEYYDVILANPPFMSPKGGIRPHKHFSIQAKRSEVLFVDYIAEHLTPTGRAAIIVPEGIIFQNGTAYKSLRKMLVEENYLVGVISLPAGIFNPYSGVKTSILWLDKTLAKKTDKVLFANIETDGFDLGSQRRAIKQNDMPMIFEKLSGYRDSLLNGEEATFENDSKVSVVNKIDIADNGEYNLSGERYKTVDNSNSNNEWIELKELVESIKDGDWIESKDQSESGIRLIQTGNIGIGKYKNKTGKEHYISEETFNKLKCTEICKKDVLVSRLPDPVGRACHVPDSNSKMITSVDCSIIRFNQNKILSKLFVFYTKSDEYYNQLTPFLTGASRKRISRKNLERIEIPIPPLSKQKEIVAEIDSYQKIIDGARLIVDNYKPRIDIDPEWQIIPLDDLNYFKVESGGTPSSTEEAYWNGDINWATLVDLPQIDYISEISSTVRKITNEGVKRSSAKLLPKNSILVSTRATIGRVAINKVPMCTNQGFKNIIITDSCIPEFVAIMIKGLTTQMQMLATGGTFKELSKSNFIKLEIPIPKLEIQKQIIEKIKKEQELVNANKQLITIFEQKIKDRIAKVWGE